MSDEFKLAPLPSRGVISVAGPEARDFLQGLITNDVEKLGETRAIYAALLTPQGKILFDFFVAEVSGALLLDCYREHLPAFLKRLSMYRMRAQVELADVSEKWTAAALFGPGWKAAGGPTARASAERRGPSVVYVDPRLEDLGLRVLSPVGEAAFETAQITAEDDYNIWRLSHGVPDVPFDAGQDKMFLLEANFEELHGVDFEKGCYVGQELAARMKHRAKVRKRLLPVDIEGALPAPGTAIKAGEREVGTLRTGVGTRALALLRLGRLEDAAGETLTANDARLTVDWPSWIPK